MQTPGSRSISRNASSTQLHSGSGTPPLKLLRLKFVNTRSHALLVFSRALSTVPCVLGLWDCVTEAWRLEPDNEMVRSSELFLAGIWCIVAGYLSYSVLDGLMVRWIVKYSQTAAIVRMLSCSALNIAMIHTLNVVLSPNKTYLLHIWILASCILTIAYTIQNFVTSNLSLEKKSRSVDLLNIAVFAVVPLGIASFITMIGLLRCLFILRLSLYT